MSTYYLHKEKMIKNQETLLLIMIDFSEKNCTINFMNNKKNLITV